MSYRAVRAHLEAAEAHFELCRHRTTLAWSELTHTTQRSATPARLLGAGFAAGLLLGIAEPLARLAQGTRFVDLATSLVSLAGALQAQVAAETAGEAADVAHEAASTAEVAGETARQAVREVA